VKLNLATRLLPLCREEWNRVCAVLVDLLHSHLASQDVKLDVSYAVMKEARLAILDEFGNTWGGICLQK